MRPTLALALAATAASLSSPVLASSPGHVSHGQGLVRRHVVAEGGLVRRMVRRVRRAEGAAVLSLPANSSTTTTSSTATSDKKKQYTSTAIWWAEAGWIGSCGEVISDTENVLALPLSLYPSPSSPSPLCGQTLTLTAPTTGKSLTARVVGASDREDYTAMSKAAFQALGGDLEGGEVGVVMEFVDSSVALPSSGAVQSGAGKVVAAASSAIESNVNAQSSASGAAQTTTTQAAKTSSPAPTTTQAPTMQAQAKQTTTTSSWDSASAASVSAASKSSADAAWASSSSAAAAAAASKSSADSAWASSSSAASYEMWASSSSSAAAAASKSSADAAWASSSSAAAAAKALQTSSSGGGSSGGSGGGKVYTGGIATFFYQNGVAGNCGQVNSDDSYIVALPTSTYAGGSHCGQSVKITRSDTGQSITAKVADSCPTCNNASCLDLSVGAYKALGGTDSMGVFDITWQFV
ncbi:hypothetical protein JCM10296v2_006144 [Rhodotorula toruloides]